jgi:hypothetical protein
VRVDRGARGEGPGEDARPGVFLGECVLEDVVVQSHNDPTRHPRPWLLSEEMHPLFAAIGV